MTGADAPLRLIDIEILKYRVKISRMINRQTLLTLTNRLHDSPAVVLLGPRQVGKTTLAPITSKQPEVAPSQKRSSADDDFS